MFLIQLILLTDDFLRLVNFQLSSVATEPLVSFYAHVNI